MSALDLSAPELKEAMEALTRHATAFLEGLPKRPAFSVKAHSTALAPAPHKGRGLLAALDDLFAHALGPGVTTASGRFLGYVPGGGLPTAAIADFVAAITNRYVGYSQNAPTATQIENEVVSWLRDFMGMDQHAWGTLTSGGSAANLLGILAARHRISKVERLHARAYLTREAHTAISRGLIVAGIDADQWSYIETDAQKKIDLNHLEERIQSDRVAGHLPWLVCASAGTVNTGAIDPLSDLKALCQKYELWLHVDAAYGGFFRLVGEELPALLPLSLADSIALDPHKGLFQPYGIGAVLVRDASILKSALAFDAPYLNDVQGLSERSPADYSFELTRPFRAPRVWLSMQTFGLDAFIDALKEKLMLARYLYRELAQIPAVELFRFPELSIVPFRFERESTTRHFLEQLLERGRFHISSTVIDKTFCLRACILSFRTHQADIDEFIDEIKQFCRSKGSL